MTIIHDHIPQPWVLSPDMSVSPCPRIVGPALSFPASFLTAFSICVPHTYMLPCPLTSHLTSPSARLSPARQSSKLGYLSTLILHSSLTLIITINHAEMKRWNVYVSYPVHAGGQLTLRSVSTRTFCVLNSESIPRVHCKKWSVCVD